MSLVGGKLTRVTQSAVFVRSNFAASWCCKPVAPAVALAKTCSAASAFSSCLLNCNKVARKCIDHILAREPFCWDVTAGTDLGSSLVHATPQLHGRRATAMPGVSAADTYRLDLVEGPLQPLRMVSALKAGEQPDACRVREVWHCSIARSRGDPPCIRTQALLLTRRDAPFQMSTPQHRAHLASSS